MKFTLEEILEATGAKVLKNTVESGEFDFSTDTRTIQKGQIYLPLKGANFDGEAFIDKALESGAVGCFVTKSCQERENREEETGKLLFYSKAALILQVEDTLTAYLQLANFYRKKINPKTVAITGSSGKTTTKEMACSVACERFKTHKSELNFNNEIGLCKTILSMPEDTEVLILEMGMRGLGEIELLSKFAEPDVSIIANVGTAHLGRLGSRENIAKAKCEIVKHMRDGGVLIAHNDKLIKNAIEANSSHLSPFTFHSIYFSLDDTKILERSIGYSKFEYKNHSYELNIEGDYNIQNSLAVIEMGFLLGMSEKDIAEGLKKYSPIEKRWETEEIGGFKIINDSYNANPESMKGVIKTVLDIYEPPLVLLLGDMGELGDSEIDYHRQVGEFLSAELGRKTALGNSKISVLTVGRLSREITDALKKNTTFTRNFENNSEISRYILDNVKFGTTIVLKASRSMKFEEIIEQIKSESANKKQ